ncbi:MAG: hypothetical protein ACYTG0_02955 [Planctomycetota bacterium]
MIAPLVVKEIERLLADGELSQRKIAHVTGVSRGTVGAIASGKRRDYVTPPADEEADSQRPTGPPQRCAECGGMVYMPCRLCRLRKLVGESRAALRSPRSEGPLKLELSDNHQARYEEVRVRRIEEGPGRRRGSRTPSGQRAPETEQPLSVPSWRKDHR